MLPVEKEMIGLLVNGACTPMENIRGSFFLVAWPCLLLAALRMVRNDKKTEGFIPAAGLQNLAQDYAKRANSSQEAPRGGPDIP